MGVYILHEFLVGAMAEMTNGTPISRVRLNL